MLTSLVMVTQVDGGDAGNTGGSVFLTALILMEVEQSRNNFTLWLKGKIPFTGGLNCVSEVTDEKFGR